jgi:hypothetical protein
MKQEMHSGMVRRDQELVPWAPEPDLRPSHASVVHWHKRLVFVVAVGGVALSDLGARQASSHFLLAILATIGGAVLLVDALLRLIRGPGSAR